LFAVVGGYNLVSLALEHQSDQAQGVNIIIHNEDFLRHTSDSFDNVLIQSSIKLSNGQVVLCCVGMIRGSLHRCCGSILRYNLLTMLGKIWDICKNVCHLEPDKLVVVGVSGGADSLCLFDLLLQAKYPVLAVYFDHRLRAEAAVEALEVERLAGGRQALFSVGSGDVRQYADQHGISIEAAARLLRYRFLFAQAEAHQAQAVAVAHHADDQVETVLMHLVRGSGLGGLGGMVWVQLPNPWSETIPLVRPMLATWRNEIVEYCQQHGLQAMEDRTNADRTYTRNRIRHELVPLLQTYNPQVKEALWRLSQVAQSEAQAASLWAEQLGSAAFPQETEAALALDPNAITAQPVAIQRQVIRRGLARLRRGLEDVDFGLVERAVLALQNPPATRQLELGLGLRLVWEPDQVWLAAWEADLPVGGWPQLPVECSEPLLLEAQGCLELGEGWRLGLEVISAQEAWLAAPANPDPFQAWMDADQAGSPLWVRCRSPGERFQPLGMGGHSQKLADFMINVKMPRRARTRWPLVCAGSQVVWVPGYALSHAVRLREATTRVYHLQVGRELSGITV
jgi:tRNA(Ile)-lysidine synthase